MVMVMLMKFKARIKDIGRTLEGEFTVTLASAEMKLNEASALAQADRLDVEIKKHRKKRSLDANAYYWLLVGKVSGITGNSKNHIHNIMLDRYGELDFMPDGSLIPFCIRDDIDYLEFPYPHLKPTQKTLSKGDRLYRWYYQIKGSSEYNTLEMSRLIDGIVSECKEMGIETIPPEELERMMQEYGKKVKKCADR